MTSRIDAGSDISAEIRALNQIFATARYGVDGKLVAANFTFLRLLECDLDDVVGRCSSSFLSDNAQRDHHDQLWQALRGGEPQQRTELWTSRDGKELWLNSRYAPLTREDGSLEAIVQIVSDVTAAQERESDERGQIAAINNTIAVAQFALDGTILDANALFLAAFGYELEDVRGRDHAIFVDQEVAGSAEYRDFWRDLAKGEHKSGEVRRIHKDGSAVWLQALYSPIMDLAGRPIKIVQYASDVTSEKLKEADHQSQVTAIHTSNCVVTFDMFGTILDANALFLRAMGYSLDEVRGRHHRLFLENAYAHSTEYAVFWHDLSKGQHRSGQYKRFGKDGREVWLQATYNPIFDTAGKPIKVIKYASVVTEERLLQAEHQGQIAAINSTKCVISFELDGTIIDANENFLDATGYRFSEVRGRHHRMFVLPESTDSSEYKSFWDDLAAGKHRSGEYKRLGKDGRQIWLQATYNPIFDLNGRPFKIVKYATDITAEKLLQADYKGQIEAINKSQGVATFALDGTILDVNENFLATLGYTIEEVKGRHHAMLVDRHVAAGGDYAEFWQTLRSGEYHAGMYKRLGKDGREIWIQASYNPILDLNGQPSKVIKYATDVSANVALSEAYEDAKRQAQHDAATSLPNRVKLSAFMSNCLAGPAGSMVVLYVDLDRFKTINDGFGHHTGDVVLGEVADRMRRALHDDQMVARVGGDEFVIAGPGMPTDAIEAFCKRLYDILTAPISLDGNDITVDISVGIAVAPTDGTTPDELLRSADAALSHSKEAGHGFYSFFATDLNEKLVAQRKMTEDMRRSLAAGDFYLEYQPRFDTRARRIRSVEALVRWAHPERGRINPLDFISLAEQNGLIVPLGDWVLHTACHTAAQWDGIGVSVNVSPIQFRDGRLVQKVRDCLASSGLPAGLLELEITEGVLLDEANRATELLAELKTLGVKLAIDDFGTGYSSLSYLRNFPFDVLKIDRSFISDLGTSEGARSIVQAIVALGRALGLEVTAEGVETNEQLVMLIADQCNEVQGYLLARPVAPEVIEQLLERGRQATRERATQERPQLASAAG
jgi:diguanylate cyclase (GGDEF)-like protein/PAS domain S-box-containing protein